MNRLSKIFLTIIIVLVIALGILAYFYIQLLNTFHDTSTLLIEYEKQNEEYREIIFEENK